MSSGSPHRRVWRLAGPIVLSNLSVPLLGAVDTAVVGHMPDPAYVGAVAVGATIFNFLYWGFGFLRMGTTGFAAQAYGGDVLAILTAITASTLLVFASNTAIIGAYHVFLALSRMQFFPKIVETRNRLRGMVL